MYEASLLQTIRDHRFTTIKRLCVSLTEQLRVAEPDQTRRALSQVYGTTRRALAELIAAGRVTCWSRGKPLYVLTEDAKSLRQDLRMALLAHIMTHGDLMPRQLRTMPLCGMTIAMDLQQELANELMRDGLIENMGRQGVGRKKIYRATALATERFADPVTVTTPVVAETLTYLMTPTKNGFRRDSALNIAERLKQPLLEVKRAIKHLVELGMVKVTAEVGALQVFGYALAELAVQRVDALPEGAPVLVEVEPAELPAVVRDDVVAGAAVPVVGQTGTAALRVSAVLRVAASRPGRPAPRSVDVQPARANRGAASRARAGLAVRSCARSKPSGVVLGRAETGPLVRLDAGPAVTEPSFPHVQRRGWRASNGVSPCTVLPGRYRSMHGLWSVKMDGWGNEDPLTAYRTSDVDGLHGAFRPIDVSPARLKRLRVRHSKGIPVPEYIQRANRRLLCKVV